MNNILFGIALLVGIVLAQVFVAKFKQRRLVKLWQGAHDAIEADRLDEAERALMRCSAMAPLWVHGLVALGMVRGKMGKTDAAVADLTRARELHPKEAEPDYGLGLLYATMLEGRDEDAIAAFRNAIGKKPELAEALAADPRLERLRGNPTFEALLAPQAD